MPFDKLNAALAWVRMRAASGDGTSRTQGFGYLAGRVWRPAPAGWITTSSGCSGSSPTCLHSRPVRGLGRAFLYLYLSIYLWAICWSRANLLVPT
eukprot:scaffold72747_cov47-Phaeocystis_antarctica.AAC.1